MFKKIIKWFRMGKEDSIKKVTILTGSGFTVADEFGCVSTTDLTKMLRELEINNLKIAGLNPGEYFYLLLCDYYEVDPSNKDSISTVNFETIIHLVEELYSYYHCIDFDTYVDGDGKTSKYNKLAKFVDILPSFLELKQSIKNDIDLSYGDAQPYTKKYQLFEKCYKAFISFIIDELIPFSNDSKNEGMLTFKKKFIDIYFPEITKRIYTLNYDDWISTYIGYFDGFDSEGTFLNDRVLQKKDENIHFNIHGCIFWDNDISRYNVEKTKRSNNYLTSYRSSEYGLDRKSLLSTPIISGYNKMQRMKFAPYTSFYYALQRDLIETDILLIIGYSFSDTHLNNILNITTGKVVICTLLKEKEIEDFRNSLVQVFNEDNFNTKEMESKGIFTLDSDRIKIWIRGIGEEFYNSWNELIK